MKNIITLFCVLAGISPALAQISVTSNSLMSWLNFKKIIEADTSGSVSVNVGSPGANQMWDFSRLSGQSYKAVYEFSGAQKTPYAGDYPGANYAFIIAMQAEGMTGTMYQYMNLSSDKLHSLGSVMELDGQVFLKEKDDDITPLPLIFGASWQSVSVDTFEIQGLGKTITTLDEKHSIDAWGKIKLPSGDYNCLRWKTEGSAEQVTSFGGVEIPIGSSTYIDYTWIGENSLLLATVSSQENETNPNFQTAEDVSWMSGIEETTGVDRNSFGNPTDFMLFNNYPNPFNPSTTISFQVTTPSDITLAVFDVNGQLVRQLLNQSLPAGIHQAVWDGRNDGGEFVAAGTYFYKLENASDHLIRKMTFLK